MISENSSNCLVSSIENIIRNALANTCTVGNSRYFPEAMALMTTKKSIKQITQHLQFGEALTTLQLGFLKSCPKLQQYGCIYLQGPFVPVTSGFSVMTPLPSTRIVQRTCSFSLNPSLEMRAETHESMKMQLLKVKSTQN